MSKNKLNQFVTVCFSNGSMLIALEEGQRTGMRRLLGRSVAFFLGQTGTLKLQLTSMSGIEEVSRGCISKSLCLKRLIPRHPSEMLCQPLAGPLVLYYTPLGSLTSMTCNIAVTAL
eukprot:4051768-Amphidinium_carterae.1